jgi:hypothetical protein
MIRFPTRLETATFRARIKTNVILPIGAPRRNETRKEIRTCNA